MKLSKENIIISLLCYDGFAVENCWETYLNLKKDAELNGHNGDCINVPQTCSKCYVEELEKTAEEVLNFLENKKC